VNFAAFGPRFNDGVWTASIARCPVAVTRPNKTSTGDNLPVGFRMEALIKQMAPTRQTCEGRQLREEQRGKGSDGQLLTFD
jgi:hypothetical protein